MRVADDLVDATAEVGDVGDEPLEAPGRRGSSPARGRAASDSVVKPTRSAKSTVTTRRSSPRWTRACPQLGAEPCACRRGECTTAPQSSPGHARPTGAHPEASASDRGRVTGPRSGTHPAMWRGTRHGRVTVAGHEPRPAAPPARPSPSPVPWAPRRSTAPATPRCVRSTTSPSTSHRRSLHRDHGTVRLRQVDAHALRRRPRLAHRRARCSSAASSSAR